MGGYGFPHLIEALRPGGRYVTAGAIAGPIVSLDLRQLYLKDLEFQGATVLPPALGPLMTRAAQVRRDDGAVIHTGSGWVETRTDHEVMSEYVLTANDSRPALNIAAQRNADSLVMQIEKTNNRLLFVVVLIILATVVLALLMVKFSVLNPLRDISYQFRVSRKRDTSAVDIAPEQPEPVSFHALGQLYETLHDMAIRDPLTGTYNRALLEDRLKQVIAEHRRTPGKAAVLLIDLVRFKYVNDLLGHHAGDLLLKEVVVRIGHVLRESDTLARLGGDEFVIILPDTDAEQAAQVAEKIIQSMVPELAELPASDIHAPWEAPEVVLNGAPLPRLGRIEADGLRGWLVPLREGVREGDVVWIGEFSFEYQPDL